MSVRRGLSWGPLLAEGLVIVLGILLALAVDAWWENRQEAEREEVLLTQLRADLLETERLMQASLDEFQDRDRGITTLLHAYRSASVPAVDSIYHWMHDGTWWETTERPVTGTTEALIATGDLRLIQSDALASAITGYLDQARAHTSGSERDLVFYREQAMLPLASIDLAEAIRRDEQAGRTDPVLDYPVTPTEVQRIPFPLSASEFMSDQTAYNGVLYLTLMRNNERRRQETMIERSRILREQIEAYLDLSD